MQQPLFKPDVNEFAVGGSPIRKVEYYDADKNQWKNCADLAFDRSGLAVTTMAGLRNIKQFTFHGNDPTFAKEQARPDDGVIPPIVQTPEVVVRSTN